MGIDNYNARQTRSIGPVAEMIFEFIISKVCADMKVSLWDVFINSRSADIVEARQTIQHLALKHTTLTQEQLAYRTGRFHHTTVISNIRAVSDRIDTDEGFEMFVERMSVLVERFAEKAKYAYKESAIQPLPDIDEFSIIANVL